MIGKAWQRKVRETKAAEPLPGLFSEKPDFSSARRSDAVVRQIDRNAAASIILEYEWLGTLPPNTSHFFGMFIDGWLVGASCFCVSGFGGKITLKGEPAICLNRGACVDFAPKWAGSALVSASCSLVAADSPIYVVAFSDWEAGEIGTIYQACNWAYLGHKRSTHWVAPDGRRLDASAHKVAVMSGGARAKRPEVKATAEQYRQKADEWRARGYRLVRHPARGKYAWAYGPKCKQLREMRAALRSESRPYPKRTDAVMGAA